MLFVAVFFILFTAQAQNPCEVMIPSDAEVIKKSPLAEKIARNETYWICNSSRVVFADGKGTIMIDEGSRVSLAKGNFIVYLRKGATLTLGLGAKGVLYIEKGANPPLSSEFGRVNCEYLVFDYSNAPKGICPEIKREIPFGYQAETTRREPINTNPSTTSETAAKEPEPTNSENPQVAVNNNPDYAQQIEEDAHLIPAQAEVVRTGVLELRKIDNDKTFWVCERTTYQHSGNNNTFYIEKGCSFTLQGGSNNVIYLKENTKISIISGSNNQVFYIGEPELRANGGNNTRFTKLSTLDFDYSQAPANGCR